MEEDVQGQVPDDIEMTEEGEHDGEGEFEIIEEILDDSVVWSFKHEESVLTVDASPNSLEFATGCVDDKMRVFKAEDMVAVNGGFDDSVSCVRYNCTGSLIAASSLENSLHIYNSDGTPVTQFEGPSGGIEVLEFHPKHPNVLLAGDGEGLLWLFNAKDGKTIKVLTGHSTAITAAKFTGDGRQIVSGSIKGVFKIWSPNSNPPCVFTHTSQSKGDVHNMILSLDCANEVNGVVPPLVVGGFESGKVLMWSTQSNQVLRPLARHAGTAEKVRFSWNNEFVCTTGMDGKVFVNHIPSGKATTISNGENGISCLEWIDNQFIVTGDIEGYVKMWDVKSGEEVKVLLKHDDVVLEIAIASSMEYGYSVSEDGYLNVFTLGE